MDAELCGVALNQSDWWHMPALTFSHRPKGPELPKEECHVVCHGYLPRFSTIKLHYRRLLPAACSM